MKGNFNDYKLILERRLEVQNFLKAYGKMPVSTREEMANRYGVSSSAITADIRYVTDNPIVVKEVKPNKPTDKDKLHKIVELLDELEPLIQGFDSTLNRLTSLEENYDKQHRDAYMSRIKGGNLSDKIKTK